MSRRDVVRFPTNFGPPTGTRGRVHYPGRRRAKVRPPGQKRRTGPQHTAKDIRARRRASRAAGKARRR